MRFRRDGYALLRRFLAPDEVRALALRVDAVLRTPLPPGCERPHNTLAPLRWDDPLVDRVLDEPRRRDLIARAVGADDLRWISAYVSVKEARSAALWWHQDWWCWDHPVTYRPEAAQIAVLCYLSDTSADAGALRALPGSHVRSVPLHAELPEAHSRSASELDPVEPAMCDHPDQVTLAVRAGDAVVTDYRLLHGTHPNSAARRRDCLLFTFTPCWRSLPDEIRAHLIRHPALPLPGSRPPSWGELLPDYSGTPRDLPLSRSAPGAFAVSEA
jgi:hypothetical protein